MAERLSDEELMAWREQATEAGRKFPSQICEAMVAMAIELQERRAADKPRNKLTAAEFAEFERNRR